MDQARSITIDGIGYDVAQFSEQVQQAVGIYNAVQADLQKSQLEALKCQAALQTMGTQIVDAVKAELAAKAEPKSEAPAANDEAAV